jgi:hypothetical protein
VVDGFEHIVDAFLGMLHGENTGKIIVAAPFSAMSAWLKRGGGVRHRAGSRRRPSRPRTTGRCSPW